MKKDVYSQYFLITFVQNCWFGFRSLASINTNNDNKIQQF